MGNNKKKLVFCGVSEGIKEMTRLFADAYVLVNCTKLDEAKARIAEGADVIVCGTQFDEGAMFDLLRHAKANSATKSIPFLCVRIAGGSLEEALFQSVELSSSVLGASGFIDLFRWRRQFGAEETDRKYRRMIDKLASGVTSLL